jgi:hypothetical protein
MATQPSTITSTNTVTVACKLPHGLILRVFDMVESSEPMFGGGWRTITKAAERPERVTLNGFARHLEKVPDHEIVGGYGITHDVPKDFWDHWYAQNKDSDFIKNNLIFANDRSLHATAEAKEKLRVRSGFEAIDPENLPARIQPAKAA